MQSTCTHLQISEFLSSTQQITPQKTHNSFLGHHFCFVLILFLLHVIMLVHQYFLAVRVIKSILQIS